MSVSVKVTGAGIIAALLSLASCALLTDVGSLRVNPDAPDAGDNNPIDSGGDPSPFDGGGGPTLTDDAGTGTGRLGSLSVDKEMVVNAYASLSSNAAAGAVSITVDNASAFNPEDAILVWQTTGLPAATSGDPAAVNLALSSVGRFEIVRVASKSNSTTLALSTPLAGAFTASTTQVVRVPEYEDVTVLANGVIRAAPWNGRIGGIVVMLISGRLRNDGAITSDLAGFRGSRGWTRPGGSLTTCPGIDGTPSDGHSAKGEGLWPAGFTDSSAGTAVGGRGNFANGGGGGNCHNSGGGGGGHGGAGGQGGRSGTFTNEDPVGGMPGSAVQYDPFLRLAFGGGGGNGDGDTQIGDPCVNGGAGGGVVFIRARVMDGSGTITANGGSANPIVGNGGGGGGAGGLVIVDVNEAAACGGLRANGGNGSTIDASKAGTTGGGGGGRVLLRATQPSATTCSLTASAGKLGVQNDPAAIDGPAHGATDGAIGTTQFVPR